MIDLLYDAKIPIEEMLPSGLYRVEELPSGTIAVTKEPFTGPGAAIVFVREGAKHPSLLPEPNPVSGRCMPTRGVMNASDVDGAYIQQMIVFVTAPGAFMEVF
ncbi:hypothetical protein A7E78_04570 [Syntrophotalea acetylenivorans]|uniref:Uncharacterized protein n=2 Tax=Syntrophotalea acetylenivorans TaxID=1842532 RepID=A0A1L3GMP9_9BACT|nr:hypothetical protein A7E78_04570 [Syntrophotalea acetylenivorans]